MKIEIAEGRFKKLFSFLILLLLLLAVIYLLIKVSPVLGTFLFFIKNLLLPFFIALIISYLLHPIVTILHERGVPRAIAVLLIYIIFFGTLTIILSKTIPLLIGQIKDFMDHFPVILQKVEGWLDIIRHDPTYPLPDTVQDGIDSFFENWESKLAKGVVDVTGWISSTIGIIFTLFLVPFVSFYILKDYKLIEKTVITFVPKKQRKEMIRLLRDIDEALGNYIRGQLLVCTFVGILAYIGYLLIGLPYALLLASIVGLTNIIPYLGPFIGAAPAVIVGLSISWKLGLSVFVVNLIIQMLEGNVISPQIVGRSLHIHPLFIILSLLIGGQVAGIVGMILAVPFFAILKVIVQHVALYFRQS